VGVVTNSHPSAFIFQGGCVAIKCEFTVKAKSVNYFIQPTVDQVVLNDRTLTADLASKLTTLIKTDPEADLTVIIKQPGA
jgi:hypothetical protein